MINIMILFGGRSLEHYISILSTQELIKKVNYNKYVICPIYIDFRGIWYQLPMLYNLYDVFIFFNVQKFLVKYIININKNYTNKNVDIVFPLLHGYCGEDGLIQSYLDLHDTLYIGSKVLGSILSINKEKSTSLNKIFSIQTVPFLVVEKNKYKHQQVLIINNIILNIKKKMFIKPSISGSSIGVYKTNNFFYFNIITNLIFLYHVKVIVEKNIFNREYEVSLLEYHYYKTSVILSSAFTTIVFRKYFYNYINKYLNSSSFQKEKINIFCKRILQKTKKIFSVMSCRGIARISFFFNREYVLYNEINTLPGFAERSIYSTLLHKINITNIEVVDILINNVLKFIFIKNKY